MAFGDYGFGDGAYGLDTGVALPAGSLALVTTTGGLTPNPLTTSREMRYTFELYTTAGLPLGTLDGVTGGSLEWNSTAQIKGGGKLNMIDTKANIDWLHVRIKPILSLDTGLSWPLGIFIPSTPIEKYNVDGRSWEIEMLDRTSVYDLDKIETTFALPTGTVVTTAVRDLLTSTGEPVGALTESTETLSAPLVWQAGTTKLTIINDILQAAGFNALWADGNGQFRIEKNVPPQERSLVYSMLDDSDSIYLPDFQIDKDIYSIPNKVVVIGQGSGSDEALIGIATNMNPESPYSYPSRGRWIVTTVDGVEATSQAVIDQIAQNTLAQLTSPGSSITVNHAPLPNWWVNSALRFRSDAAHVDGRYTITTTSISFSSTELAKSVLTEVADL